MLDCLHHRANEAGRGDGDADGQRKRTTYSDRTILYTPFPDYEITDPPTGTNVTRTTYRLAGQIVAVRKNDGTNNNLYYPLSGHLGNVMAYADVDGNPVSGSDARYDPFGAFTTTPTTSPGCTWGGVVWYGPDHGWYYNIDAIEFNGLVEPEVVCVRGSQ